ncbi:hard surface induced protein [Phlyctema vagabunda]|uniref:Hard surface induced protein n=1 Tax=Phlyctema vagabunda TaxID=108571 RepID=A0ABR4PA53_9HELO
MVSKDLQPRIDVPEFDDVDAQQDHAMFLCAGKHILERIGFCLIPSFLQRKMKPNSVKMQRLHPTSYLDGLRGVASFIVFMGHYTEENVGWYQEPYGLYEDGARSSPLQLPIIRVLYSARPMVHIFFVISGFVLAYKPLQHIHAQQYSALATTLSSSVFRRAIRLFLPSFVGLLIMALAVYFEISAPTYAFPAISMTSQLRHWWGTCWYLLQSMWYWDDTQLPPYNPALWTIPIEFAQSLVLFLIILGLSRCKVNVRLTLLACICLFCFYSLRWATVEFLGGMCLAEITLIQKGSLDRSPISSPKLLPKYKLEAEPVFLAKESEKKCKTMQVFFYANLLSGLFIASWTNNHVEETWGLAFLNAHTPAPYSGQRIWFLIAAFQIVGACTQIRALQSIFNTSIAQYLGSLSFALYLMHNLVLQTMERHVAPVLMDYLPKASFWGRQGFWLAGLCIYVPVLIWVSDLFWRMVDIPSVRFARWLEAKCLVSKKS